MLQPGKLMYRQQVLLELFVTELCEQGLRTLRALEPGLAAVVERLEYGAGKHPDEPWKHRTDREHIAALLGHTEALHERDYDLPIPERRKHLAAIACRALMALAVNAPKGQP